MGTGEPESISCNPNPDCDNERPIRYLNVNFVFLLSPSGTHNFNEKDDGLGNTSMNGYQRAEYMINTLNWMMATNQTYSLDSSLPVCETRIRYVLKSVSFIRTPHYDMDYTDAGYNNIMSSFAVNPNSEFTAIHHFNSKHSSNGVRKLGGYGPGPWVTTWNDWNNIYPNDPNYNSRNLAHELFHAKGLRHAWRFDNCQDTKDNPNLWCEGSNNVMDYNCYHQFNLTPCQICMLHSWLDQRTQYINQEGGCPPPTSYFDIPQRVCRGINSPFYPEIYLQGSACTNENQFRIHISKVPQVGSQSSIPNTIFQSWYSGQVGHIGLKQWTGYQFGSGVYRIELTVKHSECANEDSMVKWVTVELCPEEGIPANCCLSAAFMYPNPSGEDAVLHYTLEEEANLLIDMIGINLPTPITLQSTRWSAIGNYELPLNLSQFPDGAYQVRIFLNQQEIISMNLVKQQ